MALLLALVIMVTVMAVTIQAEETLPAGGAYMVALDGTETVAEDPAAAWATGSYAYVKLYGATDAFADLAGATLWVDLNGNDLTVGGEGKLYAFDSANDGFDVSKCGTVTNTGIVEVQTDVTNPVSGYRYLAVTEGTTSTFHRLDLRLTAVSLRPSAAGLYYKAAYNCDTTLAAKAAKYGVVLSVSNLPGADFAEETGDINIATELTPGADFGNGTVANSSSVFGIMKEEREADVNNEYGKIKIYANPYITFDLGAGLTVVGDNKNVNKTATDDGFTGAAYSLLDVMNAIDDTYFTYPVVTRDRVDQFKRDWNADGMASWSFVDIAKEVIDGNAPLVLTDNVGYCQVCKADVQWTPLYSQATQLALQDGDHYYLAEDVVSMTVPASTANGSIVVPGKGKTACLHLNGNNITSTNKYAIFGSGGVLNIMGTGTVAGKGSSPSGAAIQINNSVDTNAINLYGGTYTRVAGCGTSNPVLSARYRGTFDIHEGVVVDGGSGKAIYLGNGNKRRAELFMNGCTVKGSIELTTPAYEYPVTMSAADTTVTGTVTANAGTGVTLAGKMTIGKLVIAEGLQVDITDLTVDSVIPVSANGVFTNTLEKLQADRILSCFSTADEGDWVISRDGAIVQEVKPTELPATEQDAQSLEALFTGTTAYHGELHNHAKTGGRSDGNYTLEEWVAHMEEKRIDFATIVDHRQSIHMYLDAWDDACFIGGSEPAVPALQESNATQKSLHYNMVFADAAKFEEHLQNIPEFKYTPAEDGNGGFYSYVSFSVSRMKEMVQSVLDHGGFFVHVHPLFDSYLISEDPLDYWFGDKTGFEIATTEGGSNTMAQKDCVEAYEVWNELLRLNKRVFATIGDDNHKLSDLSSMTTIYASEKTAQTFLDHAREGDMTAGPVGIRMSMGDTITGGIADFEGGRLVLAVGDIHEGFYNEEERAGHTYGIELYDDGGILFATEIDPTQTTYFAIDTDASRMYYRAVVVDLTTGARIAVGNPIFNSAFYSE